MRPNKEEIEKVLDKGSKPPIKKTADHLDDFIFNKSASRNDDKKDNENNDSGNKNNDSKGSSGITNFITDKKQIAEEKKQWLLYIKAAEYENTYGKAESLWIPSKKIQVYQDIGNGGFNNLDIGNKIIAGIESLIEDLGLDITVEQDIIEEDFSNESEEDLIKYQLEKDKPAKVYILNRKSKNPASGNEFYIGDELITKRGKSGVNSLTLLFLGDYEKENTLRVLGEQRQDSKYVEHVAKHEVGHLFGGRHHENIYEPRYEDDIRCLFREKGTGFDLRNPEEGIENTDFNEEAKFCEFCKAQIIYFLAGYEDRFNKGKSEEEKISLFKKS